MLFASVVVALVPIVVAVTRGLADGWLPVGDLALIDIRSRDVLTEHSPLLGLWASASGAIGIDVNNPGPLLFDVLALPAHLVGGSGGVGIGAALLNGLAVVAIATIATRRAGPVVGVVAVLVATALAWAMGSELLYDPWHAHVVLLPFFAFLLLVWSAVCGDIAALPLAVGLGSLVLQSHLTYAVLIPGLVLWATLGVVLTTRRRRSDDPDGWPVLRRRLRRASVSTAVVVVIAWAQPVVEQLTGAGDGNLSRLAEGSGQPTNTVGYGYGVRLMTDVLALPPWWLRPSFGEQWLLDDDGRVLGFQGADIPGPAVAAVAIVAVLAVFAGAVWFSRRRGDATSVALTGTAAVAVLLGVFTAGRAPLGPFGIPQYQFFWVWVVAAFATFGLVTTLLRGRRLDVGRLAVPTAGLGLAATLVLAGFNLPRSDQVGGTGADRSAMRAARELGEQMGPLEGQGPLLLDLEGLGFTDPFAPAVMAELRRRDVPFVVADEVLVRQLGDGRRFDGTNGRTRLLVRSGDAALGRPPGARRVALRLGLATAERRELAAIEDRLSAESSAGSVRLTAEGRAALERGELPTSGAQVDDGRGVGLRELIESDRLRRAVEESLLELDGDMGRQLARYTDLRTRLVDLTVALFVAPLEA